MIPTPPSFVLRKWWFFWWWPSILDYLADWVIVFACVFIYSFYMISPKPSSKGLLLSVFSYLTDIFPSATPLLYLSCMKKCASLDSIRLNWLPSATIYSIPERLDKPACPTISLKLDISLCYGTIASKLLPYIGVCCEGSIISKGLLTTDSSLECYSTMPISLNWFNWSTWLFIGFSLSSSCIDLYRNFEFLVFFAYVVTMLDGKSFFESVFCKLLFKPWAICIFWGFLTI